MKIAEKMSNEEAIQNAISEIKYYNKQDNNQNCILSVLFYKSSVKRPAAYWLHGNLTPARFSGGCPHLLRRFDHARLYGQTGVSLSPLPVMALPGAARQSGMTEGRSPQKQQQQMRNRLSCFVLCGSWRSYPMAIRFCGWQWECI